MIIEIEIELVMQTNKKDNNIMAKMIDTKGSSLYLIVLEEFISDSMPNVFGCHGIEMSFQLEFQRMLLLC